MGLRSLCQIEMKPLRVKDDVSTNSPTEVGTTIVKVSKLHLEYISSLNINAKYP